MTQENQDSISYARRYGAQDELYPATWMRRLWSPVIWGSAALTLFSCAGCLASILSVFIGFVLAPAIAYLAVAFAEAIQRGFRARRAQLILGYLEHGIRLNLPLASFLYAAALSEKNGARQRILDVRNLLLSGTTISEALRIRAPEISARAVALVAAAEHTGNPWLALERLVNDDLQRQEATATDQTTMSRGYAFALLIAMTTVVMFVLVFVMPKFKDIFLDYNLRKLPPITEFWMGISTWFANPYARF